MERRVIKQFPTKPADVIPDFDLLFADDTLLFSVSKPQLQIIFDVVQQEAAHCNLFTIDKNLFDYPE